MLSSFGGDNDYVPAWIPPNCIWNRAWYTLPR